ncbi:uncharacterized [Tachysurus ichikawai]
MAQTGRHLESPQRAGSYRSEGNQERVAAQKEWKSAQTQEAVSTTPSMLLGVKACRVESKGSLMHRSFVLALAVVAVLSG